MVKNQRVPKSGRDLATAFPELANEWDYERNGELRPEHCAAHSHRKVWWKCKNCGMGWEATIHDRAQGNGCPYDAGKLPIVGSIDLATVYPSVAAEWDYERNGQLRPENYTAKSEKRVWWRCKSCGQRWQARIRDRARGRGCPYDAGKIPIVGRTDLASQYPAVAAEWDYERNGRLTPENVTGKSNKKVWWKCKNCNQSWQATIVNRTSGRGCPFDAGQRSIIGKNDLGTLRPDIAVEWDYERNGALKPENCTVGSNRKVWWKCTNCGNSWETTVGARIRGRGCPYDAGQRPIIGKTDLATVYPSVAAEWDYERNGDLKPDQYTAKSHKKVWWKCRKCSQSWYAVISSRTSGHGCPYDAGKRPIVGKTDLATVYPDIAAEWDCERNGDLVPQEFTIRSNKKVWWRCRNCGTSWMATIQNRTLGTGCPYDTGKKVIVGITDLLTLNPDIATDWDYEKNKGFTPNRVAARSGKSVWWKCKRCGTKWKASIISRTSGSKCPCCRY